MKIILTNLLLVLLFNNAIAQYIESANFKISDSFIYLLFEYEDFKYHNVNRIRAYQYKIGQLGRVKKDSLLLLDKYYDSQTNTISGLDYSYLITVHDPSTLFWFNFKKEYNANGKIVHSMTETLEKEEAQGVKAFLEKHFSKNEEFKLSYYIEDYEYDNKGNLIQEMTTSEEKFYTIYSPDTFLFISKQSSFNYYEYTTDNLQTKSYSEKDSLKYFHDKNDKPNSIECFHCYPKHLRSRRIYDLKTKQLKREIIYTNEGEVHSKYYYEYDSLNRLIQRTDSTGWHLIKYSKSRKYPSQHINLYTYHSNGKLKSEITKDEKLKKKYETQYNTNGYQILSCTNDNFCIETKYITDGDRITAIISSTDSHIFKTEYFYNQKGFLSEVRGFQDNKLKDVVRYYYE